MSQSSAAATTKEPLTKDQADAVAQVVMDAVKPGRKRQAAVTGGGLIVIALAVVAWGREISDKLSTQQAAVDQVPKIAEQVAEIEKTNAARDARENERDRRLTRIEDKLDDLPRRLGK